MKRFAKSLIVMLALIMVAGLATANAGMLDDIKEKGVVLVGNSPDYPPYENMDGDKRVGFDIDLMDAIAAKLGVKVEWKTMSFDTIISAVTLNQVDLGVSGFGITEDRKKSVDFTVPYFNSAQMVVVRPDSGIATADDLKGKRIGSQLGTTCVEAAKGIENVEVIEPETWSVAFMMLKTEAVDAVVADAPVAAEYAAKQGFVTLPEPLAGELNAIVVPKGNQDMVDALNAALAELEAEGVLAELSDKWMK